MEYFFLICVVIGTITASITGKMNDISTSILSECNNSVTLSISLCGTICFWSGILNIVDKAGIIKNFSKIINPITKRFFNGLKKDSNALKYIVMNITANLLGLGNAATPAGINAMKILANEENAEGTATRNMIKFGILNTASIQLFPATIISTRAKYGSLSPMEILPCVWIVSLLCLFTSIIAEKIFYVCKLK